MHRALLVVAAAAPLIAAGCSPSFKDRRTPSGDFCSDMPVLPAGQEPDREYHRLQPITSDQKARTEAERLESLRRAACLVGGDAVIEAVNEEIRGENASYVTVSSGTAIIWLRPNGPTAPFSGGTKKKPVLSTDADAGPTSTPPPETTASAEPTPTPSAVPSAAKSGKPSVPPAPSAAKSAAPSGKPPTGTTKKPTKP